MGFRVPGGFPNGFRVGVSGLQLLQRFLIERLPQGAPFHGLSKFYTGLWV